MAAVRLLPIVIFGLAIAALVSGHVAAAAIGFVAFHVVAALVTPQWWRGLRSLRSGVVEGEARAMPPVARRGGVLVALVYPDQVPQLNRLLDTVGPADSEVTVLAIDPDLKLRNASPDRVLARADRIFDERDPQLFRGLQRLVKTGGRPVTVMTALGDPAVVVLEVARQLVPSRVIVFGAEGVSAEEQRRRASVAWESLPEPRPVLSVQMVWQDDQPATNFELPASCPREEHPS